MELKIQTTVQRDHLYVWQNFNQTLFEKLSPPFPKAKLIQYDGNEVGCKVDIELDFLIFKNRWLSVITENGETKNGLYFRDQGEKLPFFLGKWSHKHIIEPYQNGQTIIKDEVSFEAPIPWLSFLLYPLIWGQFLWRIPIYKRTFSK
ncbi:Ligand-binding SRPBCC domain-containing protein [Spirosomataceae bacterium TFI 002]|nr:Ligand-binding SRPBCC domain-containing protein [Spirosomataceae bacterium TFI 002]